MAGEGNGGDIIQVKLEVLDKGNAVVDHWMLPVEHATNEISRQPVVFTIPLGNAAFGGGGGSGSYTSHRPFAYAIDFGMMNEMLILSGVSPDQNVDETQPSAHQLREIARTHWFGAVPSIQGGKPVVHGGIRITINEGKGQGTHAYQGLILNLTSDRDGGQLHWTWKMTVQVTNWPEGMSP